MGNTFEKIFVEKMEEVPGQRLLIRNINNDNMNPGRSFLLLTSLFLTFLSFCACDPSTTTKPDLIISDLSLDADNRLIVAIKNEGYGPVVRDTGTLAIAIDGKSIGGYSLANLSDKSYKNLNGTTTIPTNFKLAGSNRRVSAFIDASSAIAESNEFQNIRCITFNPPVKNGPDFIVSQLFLSGNNLRIRIKNIGNAASPANFASRIRVIVNNSTVTDLTPNLPSLAPNGSTVIAPSPAIPIVGTQQVRVLFNTNHFADEIDNTNGVLEKWLGGSPSLAAYQALLAIPKIAENMIWVDGTGTKNYNAWSAAQKADLNTAILALENGENPSLSVPPTLLPGNRNISQADAWTIYLAHIAHSLWVDVHNKVSWKLNSYSRTHLALLLDSRRLTRANAAGTAYAFEWRNLGNLTAWNPGICYDFLANHGMIKSSPQATLYKLTDWMRGYLVHISGGADYADLYGYAGPPPADKVLYPLEGKKHITAGCWGTTGLYNAVLRSVNIPVESSTMDLDGGNHSRPIFPTLNKSMPHGDDPYSRTSLPSGVPIPTAKIFYSLAEMNSKFSAPTPDCVAGTCNTVGEQAGYNLGKDKIKLVYDLRGDGILNVYASRGANYMDEYLQGPFRGGSVRPYVKPYFEAAERATMIAEIENRLTQLGGGDIEAGKAIVVARVARWHANH